MTRVAKKLSSTSSDSVSPTSGREGAGCGAAARRSARRGASPARAPLLRREPARDHGRGIRPPHAGARVSRIRVPGAGDAGLAGAAGGRRARGGLRDRRARGAHAVARERVFLGGGAGVAGAGGARARRRADRVRRRAQDRWTVDRAALRGRRARAGRHAGGRRPRRGRDRQRPHDPDDSAEDRRDDAARGARGGLLLQEGLRARQRGARGRGRAALREPAQHRGWHPPAARLADHRQAPAGRVALRDREGDADARQPGGGARAPPGAGISGPRPLAALRELRGGPRRSSRSGARSATTWTSRPTES